MIKKSLTLLLVLLSGVVMSQDNYVKKIDTETFKKEIYDYSASPDKFVYEGDVPCVIDFYANWCAPCRKMSPILEELAKEYEGKVNFYKIDTDKNKELASIFQVSSIPMFYFMAPGQDPGYTVGGMTKEGFKEIIDKQLLK